MQKLHPLEAEVIVQRRCAGSTAFAAANFALDAADVSEPESAM